MAIRFVSSAPAKPIGWNSKARASRWSGASRVASLRLAQKIEILSDSNALGRDVVTLQNLHGV